MKKLILLFLPLLSVLANAEELKFVTVLSSPVGSFNKLETVDPTIPAKSPTINFCTSIGTGGTVALKGASKPDVETMNLSQGTILGREDTGSYVLNQITMKNGGSLKGSRLLANTVQINQPTAGKSDKLYTDTLTVAGAKAEKLNVNNGESQITEQHEDPGMMWSNQYKTDKACESTGCDKQYLLKQRGNITSGECDTSQKAKCLSGSNPGSWNDISCKCTCPEGAQLMNGVCEEYILCLVNLQWITSEEYNTQNISSCHYWSENANGNFQGECSNLFGGAPIIATNHNNSLPCREGEICSCSKEGGAVVGTLTASCRSKTNSTAMDDLWIDSAVCGLCKRVPKNQCWKWYQEHSNGMPSGAIIKTDIYK